MKIDDYIRKAAENFIQTAVFVDDRIYEHRQGKVKVSQLGAAPNQQRKPAFIANDQKESSAEHNSSVQAGEETSDETANGTLSPRELLNSFAKKRIVCALYEPSRTAAYTSRSDAYQLCLASDVVILDWVLHGDQGGHTLELIDQLIKQSLEEEPEQLRLIIVYTDTHNLGLVADKIYGKIKESVRLTEDPQRSADGLALHTSNTRIMVYGKPNPRRGSFFAKYVKSEAELADAVIDQFTNLADGLLQANVLNGLAAIKKNAKKILTKFDSTLDTAFLTHRALSMPHDDAGEHLIPLIVSEIEAVLEDQMKVEISNRSLISDWVESKWKCSKHAKDFLSGQIHEKKFAKAFITNGPEVKKIAKTVISNGFAKEKDGKFSWNLNEADKINVISNFLASSEDNSGNIVLSQLMSFRTHYSHTRVLDLGTILMKVRDGTYYLCLQPACDCVRLQKHTDFPLLRLYVVTDPKKRFDYVIDRDGVQVRLEAGKKPLDLCMVSFRPVRKKGLVVATKKVDSYMFKRSSYRWIAQLKIIHAQREAIKISSQIARVGLTESEWQRRLAL